MSVEVRAVEAYDEGCRMGEASIARADYYTNQVRTISYMVDRLQMGKRFESLFIGRSHDSREGARRSKDTFVQ